MARTIDAIVREICGSQLIQIASLTAQIEDLQEQLAEAKKASDPKMNVARIEDGTRRG